MSTHVCTYFDEGDGPELCCACGSRVTVLLQDDGELILAPLDADEPVLLGRTA